MTRSITSPNDAGAGVEGAGVSRVRAAELSVVGDAAGDGAAGAGEAVEEDS